MFVSNLSHHLENLTHYHLPANISGTVFGTSDYYDATLKVRVLPNQERFRRHWTHQRTRDCRILVKYTAYFFSFFPQTKPPVIFAIYKRQANEGKKQTYSAAAILQCVQYRLFIWKYREVEIVHSHVCCTRDFPFQYGGFHSSRRARGSIFPYFLHQGVLAYSNICRSSLSLEAKRFLRPVCPLGSKSMALWTKMLNSKKHNIFKLDTGLAMRLRWFPI